MSEAIRRRLEWARKNTYEGSIYERGKLRIDEWVTLRVSDFDVLTTGKVSEPDSKEGE